MYVCTRGFAQSQREGRAPGFPEAGEEGRWKGGTNSYRRTQCVILIRCFYLRNTKALSVSRTGLDVPVATLALVAFSVLLSTCLP